MSRRRLEIFISHSSSDSHQIAGPRTAKWRGHFGKFDINRKLSVFETFCPLCPSGAERRLHAHNEHTKTNARTGRTTELAGRGTSPNPQAAARSAPVAAICATRTRSVRMEGPARRAEGKPRKNTRRRTERDLHPGNGVSACGCGRFSQHLSAAIDGGKTGDANRC